MPERLWAHLHQVGHEPGALGKLMLRCSMFGVEDLVFLECPDFPFLEAQR